MKTTTFSDMEAPISAPTFRSRRSKTGNRQSVAAFILLMCLLFLSNYAKLLKSFHTESASTLQALSNTVLLLENVTHPIEKSKCNSLPFDSASNQEIYSCTLPNGTQVKMFTSVFPELIIAGTQKGGTSSLSAILSAHPNLTRSRRSEPHFFDNRIAENVQMSDEPTWCKYRWEYYQQFTNPHCTFTFEKTPSYMLLEHVPTMIHKLMQPFPNKPKILMILRDPVDRAFSEHAMNSLRTVKIAPTSFEEKITADIENMKEQGITSAPLLNDTMTASYHWSHLPSSTFALPDRFEWQQHWKPERKNYVTRGLYAYQIHHWLPHFQLNKELLVMNYDTYHTQKQSFLNQIIHFINLPEYSFPKSLLEIDHSPGHKIRKENPQSLVMKNATKMYLQRFYAPYNALLEGLLGTEWKNAWQYSQEDR